jgi:hypothetical protein
MDPLLKKLNYKAGDILVLESPVDFAPMLKRFRDVAEVKTVWAPGAKFALLFATKRVELVRAARDASTMEGDAVLWIAYPKGSSKKHQCEFNRDTGWEPLGSANWEPVRQVAIDEDWSALRFRRVQFIEKLTRRESMALSDEAKQRTTQKGK